MSGRWRNFCCGSSGLSYEDALEYFLQAQARIRSSMRANGSTLRMLTALATRSLTSTSSALTEWLSSRSNSLGIPRPRTNSPSYTGPFLRSCTNFLLSALRYSAIPALATYPTLTGRDIYWMPSDCRQEASQSGTC